MPTKESSKPQQTSIKQVKPQQATPDAGVQAEITSPTALVQSGQHDPRPLSPNDVLQLQRTIGNQKVQRLLNKRSGEAKVRTASDQSPPAIQRDEKTDKRLDDVEKQQRVQAKKIEANTFDIKWGHLFSERIASYKQAVLRISGGFDAAAAGFNEAQVKQAQMDAIVLQLAGAAFAVIFAAGFEWVASAALGKLGSEVTATKTIIETIENPANAAVSGSVNVAGAGQAANNSPKSTPSALGFLTANLQALEKSTQEFDAAFLKRTNNRAAMTSDQWEQLDLKKEEADFQAQLEKLKSNADISQMKSDAEVAVILEKYMWAAYLASGNGKNGLGSYVEDRFNAIGLSKEAGVELSGHAYWPNTPWNWYLKLLAWAVSYNGKIKQ